MTAERVISGLIERGIPPHIAQGIAGNISVESGFNPGINEIAPLVPGSRGGFGLYQVTGPRRRQYEEFASSRGAPLDDIDAQLDFMIWELGNTEAKAGAKLSKAQTVEDAARIFSESFLRPGIPHLDRRISAAQQYANVTPQTNALQARTPEPRNALSQPQLQIANNLLDPRDFMVAQQPRNRLAFT